MTGAGNTLSLDLEANSIAVGDYIVKVTDSSSPLVINESVNISVVECKSGVIVASSVKKCEDIELSLSEIDPSDLDVSAITYEWSVKLNGVDIVLSDNVTAM